MKKSLFVLPDGKEIYSGNGQNPAIVSVTYTQMVNDTTDLDYGAACAGMIEAALLDTSGAFSMSAGDELAYYSVAEDGTRKLQGRFILEAPTKPSANTCKFTAYDRMILFDKDLSMWLASLTEWPYTMAAFLSMACAQCGVELADGVALINGDYPVLQFVRQVTGRQLIQWIAGANAAFAAITPEGKLTFSTYTDAGDLGLAVKSLKLADYSTTPIARVAVKQHEDDVGVVWPEKVEGELQIVMGEVGSLNFDKYFGDHTGRVSYEMDYRIELNGCTDVDPNIFVVRGVEASGAAVSILNVKLYVSDSGITFGAYDGGGEHPISTVCEEGKTYRVKTVLDPKTDTYDLYIDGQMVIEGGSLRCDAAAFNGIRLTAHKNSGDTAPKIYCDNISVAGQYAPVFTEDFSGDLSEWTVTQADTAEAAINAEGQLEVTLSAGCTRDTYVKYDGTVDSTEKTAIEFDFKVNGDAGSSFEAGVLLRNSGTNNTVANIGVLAGTLRAQYTNTGVAVENGKIYRVKVVTDPAASTLDVYLDDVKVAEGKAYLNSQPVWDALWFVVKGNNSASALSACFDNLAVTKAETSLLFTEEFYDTDLTGWKHAGTLPSGIKIAVNPEDETYTILDNPLLAAFSPLSLLPYVERIAQKVAGTTYTPAEAQLFDPDGICRPGTFMTVTDRYGNKHRTAVFSVKHSGGTSTVKSTGNYSRGSAGAVNGKNAVKVLQGNVAKIRVDLEEVSSDLVETTIELGTVKKEQSSFKQTVEGIEGRVSNTEETAADLQSQYTAVVQRADGVDLSVTKLREEVGTKAEQAQVTEITEHFRFAEDGLTITNSGTGMGIGVSEQRVIFTGGQDPTTVISPNAMETTNLTVGVRLDLGGFSWIPRTNKNLSLRWTGG